VINAVRRPACSRRAVGLIGRLARRGAHSDAERLASEAVAIGDETDMFDAQGDTYTDLAEVLAHCGRTENAVRERELAVDKYTCKGNVVSAQKDRSTARRTCGPLATLTVNMAHCRTATDTSIWFR